MYVENWAISSSVPVCSTDLFNKEYPDSQLTSYPSKVALAIHLILRSLAGLKPATQEKLKENHAAAS